MSKLTGIEIIAQERQRQITVEGWTPEHDDNHEDGELAVVAALYALPKGYRNIHAGPNGISNILRVLFPSTWDWFKWWKPTPENRIKELAKAGALIAAEIDRIQNLK